jgi:hypothetical protein
MTVTYKDIRRWGIENGHKCRTGKLGHGVIAAYSIAHPDTVIADLPDTPTTSVVDDEFSVSVVITGCDTSDVQNHLVEALWAVYQAGRAAERRHLLAQLGETA